MKTNTNTNTRKIQTDKVEYWSVGGQFCVSIANKVRK